MQYKNQHENRKERMYVYHLLHCWPPAARAFLSLLFLNISFCTFFFPRVSILLLFPCRLFLFTSSPSSSSVHSFSSPLPSSSSSSLPRFLPFLDVLVLLPPPTVTLTRGGTEKPKALPTLTRSREFTSKIFFSEWEAYAWR